MACSLGVMTESSIGKLSGKYKNHPHCEGGFLYPQ